METTNDGYLDLTENSEDSKEEVKEETNMFGIELPTFEMPVLDLGLTDFQSDI